MVPLFLTAFLGGLMLAVFAMLHGVDRRSARLPFNVVVEPSATLNLPLLAAAATWFGAAGYLLSRYTALGVAARLAIAAVGGGVAALGALALIQRWALPGARREVVDERYLLQGLPARVTAAIGAGETAAGSIAYEIDGTRHDVPAVSLDGSPVDANTDVVIERVEDGVAYVEAWDRVEQRL
jgi:hypothetical protein